MTPNNKQINEVTKLAIEQGVPVEYALKTFANCSLQMYKSIGAAGLVDAAKKTKMHMAAAEKNGVSFSLCTVIKVTDKAFLVSLPGLKSVEKWIPKSVIVDDVIPNWVINK